jgi:acetyl-CoA synthetase
MAEDQLFEPSAAAKARAKVTAAQYEEMYARSLSDPDGFWAEHGKRIDWIKPPTKIKNTTFAYPDISIKWFEDGVLNITTSCIDRHLPARAQQTAITKNVAVQVMFDANNHRLRILQDYNNNGVMDATDSVRYRPLADGAEFQSPPGTIDGVAAAYMTGSGVVETGNPLQRAIRIGPNGALSGDAVIYIGSPRRLPADFRAMTIIGATARTGFWSRGGGSWRQRDN